MKRGAFFGQNVRLFCPKSGPGPKSRNIEQTLAWRIRTKGSDPSKVTLFDVAGRQKGDQKRGVEKGRKKGGKREAKGGKRGGKRDTKLDKNEDQKREGKKDAFQRLCRADLGPAGGPRGPPGRI